MGRVVQVVITFGKTLSLPCTFHHCGQLVGGGGHTKLVSLQGEGRYFRQVPELLLV